MLLTLLLSGVLRFDPMHPKHPGRDRIVWSAGHCTPLFHALVLLIYESLRRHGLSVPAEIRDAVTYPEDLTAFRRYIGRSGHVESSVAFADVSTGSSGRGLSAVVGLAALHRSCGLPTNVFVIAGDAETEDGMSYEARNLASTLGLEDKECLRSGQQPGRAEGLPPTRPVPPGVSIRAHIVQLPHGHDPNSYFVADATAADFTDCLERAQQL
jgi:transketolase